jgi:hypothetical protein
MSIELLEDSIALVYELDEGVRADTLEGDGELTELVLLLYLLRESNRVAGSAIDIAYGSRINTRPIALAIGPWEAERIAQLIQRVLHDGKVLRLVE